MELIECVPNISEGRRLDAVDAIAASLAKAPGVRLLDRTSDADHNRSVFTLAGSAAGLLDAVRRLYSAALETGIDMRAQSGEHPRIGAVDVVPFIPLRGVEMERCVELSLQAAEMIAREFEVPVFLYADSAQSSQRRKLADIRREGFEGLVEKMRSAEWQPDFGPAAPHPVLGATAVGARFFLIAYNLQLDTPSIAVARAIARSVRAGSPNGLGSVQAMGVYLAGRRCAQVSMNLLDYRRTPLHAVQERIEREARQRGATIVSAELIGLMPRAALTAAQSAGYDLKIEGFSHEMILENALAAGGLI